MISYSSDSAADEEVEVREATRLAQEQHDLLIDGPLQV
jgi:phosphotransacetylase